MNINKNEMTMAFIDRQNPNSLNKFIGYLDQLANHCVLKLRVNPYNREDVKQVAVEHAFKKMDLYDPTTGSAAYSYFYKVIYMRCLYELRAERQKKSKAPHICSLDVLQNVMDDNDESEPEFVSSSDDDNMIIIDGVVYPRDLALRKVKEARSLIRKNSITIKRNRLYSLKEEKYITINDDLIESACFNIIEKRNRHKVGY